MCLARISGNCSVTGLETRNCALHGLSVIVLMKWVRPILLSSEHVPPVFVSNLSISMLPLSSSSPAVSKGLMPSAIPCVAVVHAGDVRPEPAELLKLFRTLTTTTAEPGSLSCWARFRQSDLLPRFQLHPMRQAPLQVPASQMSSEDLVAILHRCSLRGWPRNCCTGERSTMPRAGWLQKQASRGIRWISWAGSEMHRSQVPAIRIYPRRARLELSPDLCRPSPKFGPP